MANYFVVYETVSREGHDPPQPGNIILRGTHPVTWAASPPPLYNRHFYTRLLWFREILDEVVEIPAVAKWVTIERSDDD